MRLNVSATLSRWSALCFVLAAVSFAQNSANISGAIEGDHYANHVLHFSYRWPKELHPVPVASLNLHPANPLLSEFPLFSARQGSDPYGIIIIAEKLHIPTAQNPAGFKDGPDFLRRIEPSVGPHFKQLATDHVALGDGFILDELDYLDEDGLSSGIAVNVGDYLVVFKCNARSKDDLAMMTRSAASIHKAP